MKTFLKNLILPVAVVMMFGGFASSAFAVTSFVTFIPNPLFVQGNFLPADEAIGAVEVNNLDAEPQTVIAEAVHVLDPGNLSGQLHLLITKASGGAALYDGPFSTFLTGGERILSVLPATGNETYTFKVTFDNINDNSYQGKTLGFNLCVGFQGGQTRCGDTVIGDEEDTGGGDNNDGGGTILGSGGSSRGGGTTRLLIFNEQAASINPDGSATITWNTNLFATSQVVYGPTPPPYTLNLGLVNFGYPSGTTETITKVLNHSVLLTGLTQGQTYVYRVVSRASPPTVSVEHTFTMPTRSAGNVVLAQARPVGVASISEESEGAGETLDTEATSTGETEAEAEDNSNLLAFALGGLNFGSYGLICVGVALLIFLVFLGLLWLIYQKKKDRPLAGEIALLIVFGLVASVILWLIPYTCPIIPLWVIVAIYVIWRLVSERRSGV